MHAVRSFLRSASGVSSIEYAMIAGAIALVIFPVLGPLGSKLSAKFGVISNTLN